MYDIFYLGKSNSYFNQLKEKYPALRAVNSFEEAKKKSLTKFFWLIPDDVIVLEEFNFDYVPDEWSQEYIHVFKNTKNCNVVVLFSRNSNPTDKELKNRIFNNQKNVNIIASKPKPYDVVFISYQETNADENYEKLLKKYPTAKRIHGIKGIHQAHIEAANVCETDMFWIVDGDAQLVDNFNFDYKVDEWDSETVHVWRSVNPINNLMYGYGGVKLFPRQLTINMDTSKPDMTTSITNKFKAMPEISNISAFNTDPFNTWRSAFRECAKLSSKVIDRQKDDETNKRLETWCSVGEDKPFGYYAITGAQAGADYGFKNKNNLIELKKINDFDWLKEQYNAYTQ